MALCAQDRRDAEDAVQGRDGYSFAGARLRVEIAKTRAPGGGRDDFRGGRDDRRGGGGYGGGGGGGRGGGGGFGGGPSRRTEYRVTVKGLPSSASWQDLKDHMRSCGGT
eukprot:5246235-Pyramimonas_sp.AAC.1